MRRAALVLVLLFLPLAVAGCVRAAKPGGSEGDDDGLGEGMASYYGPGLAGRPTANGERFDPKKLTAAHRTLRFGTCVRVKALATGREVEVRINDRGPYAGNRIIDLSEEAARRLGVIDRGVTRVRLQRCP